MIGPGRDEPRSVEGKGQAWQAAGRCSYSRRGQGRAACFAPRWGRGVGAGSEEGGGCQAGCEACTPARPI